MDFPIIFKNAFKIPKNKGDNSLFSCYPLHT